MAASISTGRAGAAAAKVSSRFGYESLDPISGEPLMHWVLNKNRSMSPAQLLSVYLGLAMVSLGIAGGFWIYGATLVLPFAGTELLAMGLALAFNARHAADGEDIRLDGRGLTVLYTHGRRIQRLQFQPSWVRVEPEHGDRSLIELSGQGQRIAVGRFVRPERRRQLADEFRSALRRWRPGVTSVAT